MAASTMSMTGLKSCVTLKAPKRTSLRAAAPKATKMAPRQVTKAFSDVNLTISVCNASMLFLGRFAFLPYQRAQVENAGLPVQNGQIYAEAGDKYAKEASFITSTGDPAGFNIIDVMAWGSLGHVLGFFVLATATNGYGLFTQ